MSNSGLVFRIRYRETSLHENVWLEDILEDGTFWPQAANTFAGHIQIGEEKGRFDINDPAYQKAPEMEEYLSPSDSRSTTPSDGRVVSMLFCLPTAATWDSGQVRQTALCLTRAVMTTLYPGAKRH
jgi:hypothetical protein